MGQGAAAAAIMSKYKKGVGDRSTNRTQAAQAASSPLRGALEF